MIDFDTYIKQISESLKKLDPYLVMVFGSYKRNHTNEDSDLDRFNCIYKTYVQGVSSFGKQFCKSHKNIFATSHVISQNDFLLLPCNFESTTKTCFR